MTDPTPVPPQPEKKPEVFVLDPLPDGFVCGKNAFHIIISMGKRDGGQPGLISVAAKGKEMALPEILVLMDFARFQFNAYLEKLQKDALVIARGIPHGINGRPKP